MNAPIPSSLAAIAAGPSLAVQKVTSASGVEAWLVEEHPDYAGYRLAVPRQFIPWVW